MRSGLVVKKIGMTRVYTKMGDHIPVTILHLQKCQVIAHKTIDKHGYTAVQIGVCDIKNKKVNKPIKGIFNNLSMQPKKKIVEFRVSPKNLLKIGEIITVNHFLSGQKVDITGKSIGKGFCGVIKRHNFSGHRASHGNSVTHRAHGSTGQRQDPGKVFKGKKMAGRMGNKKVTIQNLTILYLDVKNNIIIVKGSVPGSKKSFLLIKDAIKYSTFTVETKENFLKDD